MESPHSYSVLRYSIRSGTSSATTTPWTAMRQKLGEGSLGIHIDVSHSAATPPGMTVTVDCECIEVDGKKCVFHVKAHDEEK